MNTSGEAAEQIVRMTLEAGEAALRITGEGAKHLAVILYAVLKEEKKTKGRTRLETLVRSGKPLTVFSVRESDLKQFVQEAKRYGIMYCAVRDPKGSSDGMVDIMVKEEDAPRINRIVERFQFASVTEAAQVKTEIERSREEKGMGSGGKEAPAAKDAQDVPEKGRPARTKEDKLVDELYGKPAGKEAAQQENPSLAKTGKSPLSAPTSEKQERTARGTSKPYRPEGVKKPSVREELREIQAGRKQEADRQKDRGDRQDRKQTSPKPLQHKQPQKGKRRSKKVKER